MLLSPVPEPDPLRRLLTYFEGNIAKAHESEGRCPCLVIKLSAEVGDFSEPMRQVLAGGNRQWIDIFTALIQEGIDAGSIPPRVQAATAAPVILDLWTGAMQRAATLRESAPLREAVAFVRMMLSA